MWRRREAISRVVAVALLLVAALPCCVQAAGVARVVPVDVRLHPEQLFDSATYLDDPKGAYDIDDVSHGNVNTAFAPFPRERLDDRAIEGWFRFAVRLAANDTEKLAIASPMSADVFDVYYPRNNGTYGLVHAGVLVPFADRSQAAPYPVVPVTPEVASGRPVYVYVASNRFVYSGDLIGVRPETAIVADSQDRRARDNFFGGLLFAVIVINLFLGFYLRDRTFFAYVLAMVFHVLTQFTQDGTSWTLFWPHASVPFAFPAALFEGLFFVSLAIFWRTFLKRPGRSPWIDRFLLGMIGLTVVHFAIVLTVPRPGWLNYADFPNAYCFIIIALVDAIAAVRQGYRAARFLILALTGLLFFWVIGFYGFVSDVPTEGILGNIFANAIYYGVAWDALFLTFALADRIETATRSMIAAQRVALEAQAETVERLKERDVAMSRFLPRAFLEHLGRSSVVDVQLGDNVEREMTILFSDIRSFTTLSEAMTPDQTFRFLNAYLRRAGPIIREHEGFIDKYIGDAVMGLFPNDAHTAIDAAIAMQRSVDDYNRERARAGYSAISIGVGLHRGRLMFGAIGESERIETTVIADAVNVAARTETLTKEFRAPVIVTEAVLAALARPGEYRLRPLGNVVLYGASRGLAMFEVFDGDPPEVLVNKVRTLDDFTAGVHALTAGAFAEARDAFTRVREASPNDATAAYFLERSQHLLNSAPSHPWDGTIHLETK